MNTNIYYEGDIVGEESQTLEFKNWCYPFKRRNLIKIYCLYCSWLNTRGGTLVFGVEDINKEVVGLPLDETLKERIKKELSGEKAGIIPKIKENDITISIFPVLKKPKENKELNLEEDFKGRYLVKVVVKRGDGERYYSRGGEFNYIKTMQINQKTKQLEEVKITLEKMKRLHGFEVVRPQENQNLEVNNQFLEKIEKIEGKTKPLENDKAEKVEALEKAEEEKNETLESGKIEEKKESLEKSKDEKEKKEENRNKFPEFFAALAKNKSPEIKTLLTYNFKIEQGYFLVFFRDKESRNIFVEKNANDGALMLTDERIEEYLNRDHCKALQKKLPDHNVFWELKNNETSSHSNLDYWLNLQRIQELQDLLEEKLTNVLEDRKVSQDSQANTKIGVHETATKKELNQVFGDKNGSYETPKKAEPNFSRGPLRFTSSNKKKETPKGE